MKGAILSFSILLLSLTVFVSLIWYIQFEDLRATTNTALKKSIYYTMQRMLEEKEVTQEKAMNMFVEYIEPMLKAGNSFEIKLLGYHDNPLLLRFSITVTESKSLFHTNLSLEETMIEEQKDEK